MGKITSSKDLIMFLLYAKGYTGKKCEPIRGRTRLMKMVFLFDREIRKKFNWEKSIPDIAIPDFTAYDYGPFSAQVFTDLEFLVDLKFVEVNCISDTEPSIEEEFEYAYWQAGTGGVNEREGLEYEEEFSLTTIGREFVESGDAGRLTNEQWAILDKFKSRCTGTSLRALLKYVYTKYPDMTKESKIRKEILSDYPF